MCGPIPVLGETNKQMQIVISGLLNMQMGNKYANCGEVAQTHDLSPNQALTPYLTTNFSKSLNLQDLSLICISCFLTREKNKIKIGTKKKKMESRNFKK